jgi:hypothetical protein
LTILSALALSKNCLLIEEIKDSDGKTGMRFRGYERDTNRAMFHSSDNIFECGENTKWIPLINNLERCGILDFERNSLKCNRVLKNVRIDPCNDFQL